MPGPRIAVFAMGGAGHVQRLRPMVAALVEQGARVDVYTAAEFAPAVIEDGGRFHDLFDGRAVTDDSRPVPCRWVTFAAQHGESIAAELHVDLVISDSFSTVGRVVAAVLGVPHVDMRSGHDVDPTTFAAGIEPERVAISDVCHAAVDRLQARMGWADASPFLYGTATSAVLNVVSEPPAFLSETTRRALQPVVCFGSLPPTPVIEARQHGPVEFPPGAGPRVYVSFGTVAWWYYAADALQALKEIVRANTGSMIISLGGADVNRADLSGPRIRAESHVNQWRVLRDADVFVTHHGLNSTHEAIYSRVPMISRPFFGDQPAMAATCQRMGIALPGDDIEAALTRVTLERERLDQALAETRDLELAVMADRPAVMARILDLC